MNIIPIVVAHQNVADVIESTVAPAGWEWNTEHSDDGSVQQGFHMSDTSGSTVTDYSSNSRNGTAQGVDTTDYDQNVSGKFGSGYEIKTTTGVIDGTFATPMGNAGTCEMYLKLASWSDSAYGIFCDYGVSLGTNNIIMYKNNANNLEFGVYFGGTYKYGGESCSGYNTSNWHHIAVTWDTVADQVKAFHDGSQIGSTATGLGTPSASNMAYGWIGRQNHASSYPQVGFYDEWAFSSVVRYT